MFDLKRIRKYLVILENNLSEPKVETQQDNQIIYEKPNDMINKSFDDEKIVQEISKRKFDFIDELELGKELSNDQIERLLYDLQMYANYLFYNNLYSNEKYLDVKLRKLQSIGEEIHFTYLKQFDNLGVFRMYIDFELIIKCFDKQFKNQLNDQAEKFGKQHIIVTCLHYRKINKCGEEKKEHMRLNSYRREVGYSYESTSEVWFDYGTMVPYDSEFYCGSKSIFDGVVEEIFKLDQHYLVHVSGFNYIYIGDATSSNKLL